MAQTSMNVEVPASAASGSRQMIVVLGMHRSGTSSVAGTFARLGAALPKTLMPRQPDNPAGFNESSVIVQLNDALLLSAGSAWDDWRAPDVGNGLLDRAIAVLQSEFADARLAVVKDPRMCRLLPFWRRALEGAGYQPLIVTPLRSPFDVAKSLNSRNQMPLAEGMLLWLSYVLDAERDSRGCKRSFVPWSSFLDDWRREIRKIGDDLGVTFSALSDKAAAAGIDAYLDKSQRHHGAAADEPILDGWFAAANTALLALASSDAAGDAADRLDAVGAEFGRATQAFAPLLARPVELSARRPGPGLQHEGGNALDTDRTAESVTAPAAIDPAVAFVHDSIRKRLRPDEDPVVTSYVDRVVQEGRCDHTVRAMETLRLLQERNLLSQHRLMAETGSLGEVGNHLITFGYQCEQILGDLRYNFEAPTARYDLLLSLEVFEHIKDQDPKDIHELAVFNSSGVLRFAEECWRIIKPGGCLVLTTSNACSLFSVVEVLQGRAPMLWRQHVREYTPAEVTEMFEATGFQLEYFVTWYAYHFLDPDDIEPLLHRYLDATGASRENRGDDMCFIFTKSI